MKKNLQINFEGPKELLVWKTYQNFGADTEAVVPFSHEAVFVKDGQIIETLGPGRHTLNEKSGGFWSNIFKRKQDEFDCAIYYVNKNAELQIPWGTATPIDLFDSILDIPVKVGACGELTIRVNNPRKLLVKLVGTEAGATVDTISDFFSSKVTLYIKDALADAMITNKISFYEISTKLVMLSKAVEAALRPEFDNYGVEITSFVISTVVIPENIKREMEQVYMAKKKMSVLETSYKDEKEYSIKEKQASAPKVCGKQCAPAGKFCTGCGTQLPADALFCSKCGKKQ